METANISEAPIVTIAMLDAAKKLFQLGLDDNIEYNILEAVIKHTENTLKTPIAAITAISAVPTIAFEKSFQIISKILSATIIKLNLEILSIDAYELKHLRSMFTFTARHFLDEYNPTLPPFLFIEDDNNLDDIKKKVIQAVKQLSMAIYQDQLSKITDLSQLSEIFSTTASFVKIPKGSFMMGSPLSEANRHNDELQRQVNITKDFEIMTTEVTQLQWFSVMGYNPSHSKESYDCDNYILVLDHRSLCPNSPVESVAWNSVKKFIKKLNELAGENVYRLPTEAEWEYAARGGTTTAYSFGDSSSNINDYAWYDYNSKDKHQPYSVGLKKANPYGLYDVHGNVWEWVEDLYTVNPSGGDDPLGLTGEYHVIRGGSYERGVKYIRSASRQHFRLEGHYLVGFRLVRNLKN